MFDEIKNDSMLKHWDVNKVYGWTLSQTLLQVVLNGLKKHLNLIKISQNIIVKIMTNEILLNIYVQNTKKIS